MKKIKGLVKMDEERISQRILYVMVGLVVAVFLCFYLIGFDEPFAADSSFNAPMLTDLLISCGSYSVLLLLQQALQQCEVYVLHVIMSVFQMVFQHERLLQSYMVQPSFALF